MCIQSFFLLFTFKVFEDDLNLFWSYHFGNFWKNQEKGRQFHFLPRAPETHGMPLSQINGDPKQIAKIQIASTR